MQVPGLGDAVGRVGERRRRGGRAELAQAELAGEQVGADEAQRLGEQEQQVVTDERRDGARAEERRRAVAEQRIREREAQRVRVEGVGVEQVQRVVEHRVTDPGDLPGGAHGSPRSGAMRLDMCRTSGQVVSTASATPGDDTQEPISRPRIAATAPSARRARRALRAARAACPRRAAAARVRRGRRGSAGVRGAGDAGAQRLLVFAAAGIGAAYGAACDHCGASAVRRAVVGRSRTDVPVRDRHLRKTAAMKVLVVGAGGVGAAFAAIAQRRPAFEQVVLADVAPERVKAVVAALGEPDRFSAERVDASEPRGARRADRARAPDAVLNACDPRFNEPIFEAAFEARSPTSTWR